MPIVNQTPRPMKVNISAVLFITCVIAKYLNVLCCPSRVFSPASCRHLCHFCFSIAKKCRRWKCGETRIIYVTRARAASTNIKSRFLLLLLHLFYAAIHNEKKEDCTNMIKIISRTFFDIIDRFLLLRLLLHIIYKWVASLWILLRWLHNRAD